MTIRRIGRPGLIGLAFRTAALGGLSGTSTGETMVWHEPRTQDREDWEHYAAAYQQARIEAAALAAMAHVPTHAPPPAPLLPAPPPTPPPAPPHALVSAVPPGGPAGTNFLDDLQRLAELSGAGLLSEEEFAAAKAKLLR